MCFQLTSKAAECRRDMGLGYLGKFLELHSVGMVDEREFVVGEGC